ncbi:hypothetical protein NIES2135_46440 [Leptolyngbya boryana NIES-2135]|jgi:hypothetical protein|uniref:Uncharacterized protein n=1 Tax=Leptolyngbya boryana NIES-2135 TaxID=1973484 RepID=A0A1Z4JM74_LEPBY|nr:MULTISPECIES: hypothetical protein [Leptolyngbya]BAY57773.1 hypothetical protein NIES2135_46440 [Leptolyngbya boryana NIES-2135]MBD2367218.1 hypothetical protein [Leptolyngbya sp. FACHB-161]MBD2373743.1 hypothetical protein [Leptolyngbya sp. FACHB-238]MBD2398458.1 hypothetical protein [Leptolyngbya sp. FACHB-239]MBD2404045.1 hypothetical protein [Leptolyngbya sp. FACHB-402]
MNDLERNRIRRLENHVSILITQLAITNTDLWHVVGELYTLYDPSHPRAIELSKKQLSIGNRIEAIRSLNPQPKTF